MDGDGPQEQVVVGCRCRHPHVGDGPMRPASSRPGVGTGLRAAFLTDGFNEYKTAILAHFGYWIQPERRSDKGAMPKPRWMPLPNLLYAQVVKSYRRRRIVGVKHCVV